MRICTRTTAYRTIVRLVLALCLPVIAAAQTETSGESRLPSGAKIRFELEDGSRHEGRLISLDRETLRTVSVGASESAIPVVDIRKLEVMNGRHRRVLKSALIGAASGVVIGGAAGAMTYEPCVANEFLGCLLAPESRMQSAAMGAIVVGLPGLVVGGLVGLIPREQWVRVGLETRVVQLRTRRLPDGANGVGVAIAF